MKVSFEGLRSHLLSSYNSLTRKLNNATEKDSDGRDYDKIEINASEIEREIEGIRNIAVTMAYMFQEGEDGFKEMENPHFEDFHPEEEEDQKNYYYICGMDKKKWILEQHSSTNHMYDKYLPYEFHLRMVVNVYEKFKHMLSNHHGVIDNQVNVYLACWGHDLIEDTRVSYNDVKEQLGQEAADIIYALTNEKGKNRKERANDKYYEGIRNTPGAVFVKLCDRIANVQYSKMTGSRMFEMYKKENINFMVSLDRQVGNDYEEMYQYLIKLFEDQENYTYL